MNAAREMVAIRLVIFMWFPFRLVRWDNADMSALIRLVCIVSAYLAQDLREGTPECQRKFEARSPQKIASLWVADMSPSATKGLADPI